MSFVKPHDQVHPNIAQGIPCQKYVCLPLFYPLGDESKFLNIFSPILLGPLKAQLPNNTLGRRWLFFIKERNARAFSQDKSIAKNTCTLVTSQM